MRFWIKQHQVRRRQQILVTRWEGAPDPGAAATHHFAKDASPYYIVDYFDSKLDRKPFHVKQLGL
jgi:hypothetical protein